MLRKSQLAIGGVVFSMLLCGPPMLHGQVSLGSAQGFAVLAAAGITNAGPTTVTGDLGVSPGTMLVGFPPGIVTGTIHVANSAALQARVDATSAYTALAARPCTVSLTGQDLGGLTLTPGVYCFSTSAQLTGALTLDALGSSSASFVFQIGTTLTTASASTVTVIHGGRPCTVFWQVGTSATLGSSTDFVGNLVAAESVTLTSGTTVAGRVLALSGAVTMDTNAVILPPECQCTTPASVTDLGAGCGSPAAPVLASIGAPPAIGQTVTLAITSAFPSAPVALYLSNCGAAPFLLTGTSCTVYLDLPSLALVLADTTDGAGNWALTYTVPSDPSLVGRCFFIQAVVCSGTGPISGCALTNGLQATFGCS